jgi:uncharacterized repeat protein (TIGR01451 family)
VTKTPRLAAAVATSLIGVAAVAAVLHGHQQQTPVFDGLGVEYAQHVFATTADLSTASYIGGVVVLQDGDVIAAECAATGARLHRFSATSVQEENDTPIHQETARFTTPGGCGITYHPDGFIYSNMWDGRIAPFRAATAGVVRIDLATNTGTVLNNTPPGNALGITVDPITGHLVYAGQGCRPGLSSSACALVEVTTLGIAVRQIPLPAGVVYVGGVAFDPTGAFVFVTSRIPDVSGGESTGELLVLLRDGTVVQQLPLPTEPIGIAFHRSPDVVVTTNVDGSITGFDFGGLYTQVPTVTPFAYNGFRADLAQAGPDGCLYVTQSGTRYNDGDSDENASSIVRICEGFIPPPGITPDPPPAPSSICGFVYHDLNNDGARLAVEPGISGVALSLSGTDALGRTVSRATATDSAGGYCFDALRAGTYTVTESQPGGYFDGLDASPLIPGNQADDLFAGLALDAGRAAGDNNFGEILPASLSGFVYLDSNNDGVMDGSDAGIAGAGVALSGKDDRGAHVELRVLTGSDGGYRFGDLRPGSYTIEETQPEAYRDGPDTIGTQGGEVHDDVFNHVELGQDTHGAGNNFGELPLETDLRISATVPGNVTAGQSFTYAISVTNPGPAPAEAVVVRHVVPPALRFGTLTAAPGWTCSAPSPGNSGTVDCRKESLAAGEMAALTVTLTAPCVAAGPRSVSLTAEASSTTPDVNPDNNSKTVSSQIKYPEVKVTNAKVSVPEGWPPNHKMAQVRVDYAVNGGCGIPKPTLDVSSNEAANGKDWAVRDAHNLELRAERNGSNKAGRIYTVTVTAVDDAGTVGTADVNVVVPHDQGKKKS